MNHVIELPDDDGTGFDAGDLGTAWLPYTEPRACDLEALAVALIQHAKDMSQRGRSNETGTEATTYICGYGFGDTDCTIGSR